MTAIIESQPAVPGEVHRRTRQGSCDRPGRTHGPAVRCSAHPVRTSPARPPVAGSLVLRTAAVVCVAVAMVIAGLLMASGGVESTSLGAAEHVVVGPGDTMYSIAAAHDPAASTAELVEEIASLNGGHHAVALGDVIAVPPPQS